MARPSGPAAGRTQFVYTAPMTSTQFAVAPSILNRSYRITAEIEVPQGGANGVLVTQGGRFSGWGLYLKDGKPTFTYNLLDVERSKESRMLSVSRPMLVVVLKDWVFVPSVPKIAARSMLVLDSGSARHSKRFFE